VEKVNCVIETGITVEKVNCVIETGITVSEEANSQLEGPLTIQELQTALQGMQGWRAPGIDGLSVEFYRAYWDDWRPVSLLCVDYKLLSKALATRLGRAVEQVIHRDQTYCVPGRSMVDNVHLIRDVLEVSSSLDINTGLISLDQEKAFDRVEHSFLWKNMVWRKDGFKYLGVFLGKEIVVLKNWEDVTEKIEGKLS
ncbi:hypothetical protein NHX12_009145, partial [Muraenolepis orangiensis]